MSWLSKLALAIAGTVIAAAIITAGASFVKLYSIGDKVDDMNTRLDKITLQFEKRLDREIDTLNKRIDRSVPPRWQSPYPGNGQ